MDENWRGRHREEQPALHNPMHRPCIELDVRHYRKRNLVVLQPDTMESNIACTTIDGKQGSSSRQEHGLAYPRDLGYTLRGKT